MNQRLISLFLFMFLTSCASKKEKVYKSYNHLVEKLVNDLIKSGELENRTSIIGHTYPFVYYTIETGEDGIEFPPPEYFSRNEQGIFNSIDMNLFPNSKQTLNHLKYQLTSSTSKEKFDFGKNTIEPNNLDLDKPYYKVYKPIFNLDSTGVYLEIDYHHQIYGDGRAFVFELKNGVWENVKFIPTWIR